MDRIVEQSHWILWQSCFDHEWTLVIVCMKILAYVVVWALFNFGGRSGPFGDRSGVVRGRSGALRGSFSGCWVLFGGRLAVVQGSLEKKIEFVGFLSYLFLSFSICFRKTKKPTIS